MVFGVQLFEKSGVVDEKKNVIAMASMPIIEVEDFGIEAPVALPIDMPDMVLVGAMDMVPEPIELDIDISMTSCVREFLTALTEDLEVPRAEGTDRCQIVL